MNERIKTSEAHLPEDERRQEVRGVDPCATTDTQELGDDDHVWSILGRWICYVVGVPVWLLITTVVVCQLWRWDQPLAIAAGIACLLCLLHAVRVEIALANLDDDINDRSRWEP